MRRKREKHTSDLSGASLETALTTAAHADHQANVTQQNHDRLRQRVDGITGTTQVHSRQIGDLDRKGDILVETIRQTQANVEGMQQALRLHATILERHEDDAHAHPTEGDSALEERLAAVERLLSGNDEPVARDYLNDDWPRARPFREDGELAARVSAAGGHIVPTDMLPERDCQTQMPHDAHGWVASDGVAFRCPGWVAPEATEPEEGEDEPQPTRQQRWWLYELLRFHEHGAGGRVTVFIGGGIRSGKTWLMRQLEARGYPEDGPWLEWAERWALAPDANPHLTMDAGSLREALRGEQRAHEATIAELVRMRRRAQEAEERAENAAADRDRRGVLLENLQTKANEPTAGFNMLEAFRDAIRQMLANGRDIIPPNGT